MEVTAFVKFLILTATAIIGYVGGYYLTEVKPISKLGRLFQFHAFQCRPCLSYHITWYIGVAAALYLADWWMAFFAILFALFLYVGLEIDQEEKTEEIK